MLVKPVKKKWILFVSEPESKMYVQVSYLMTNEETIKREYGNLLEISDNYPKYLVTMDELGKTTSYEGVELVHVKDFCLKLC